MSTIKITNNHPNKERTILGPIGRFFLKLVNWDIVGNLPDKKRIIIASAPHSSTFDAIYAYIVCLSKLLGMVLQPSRTPPTPPTTTTAWIVLIMKMLN